MMMRRRYNTQDKKTLDLIESMTYSDIEQLLRYTDPDMRITCEKKFGFIPSRSTIVDFLSDYYLLIKEDNKGIMQ
jgi:hypothetical protein